ncbi:carboxypeptidase B-like isoform X2 [Phlebotomus papatasi]|uniref:carboxypeptidase B-like isoform X2 n=1 Tax=Phlebotomus papatasi TaxID=29031 RepID=UPI002483319F|nr:carboxypeptidase B-like isoform X2 [Phlebotomus papatasi]
MDINTLTTLSDRMWRKTRSYNEGSSCRGVDGNRNYNYFWDYGTGVSTDPCAENFLGPKPNSEPEVQAVANQLEEEANGLRLYISYHSFGNWLIYPWAYEKIFHPNYIELDHVARLVSTEIYKMTGRAYTIGNTATILYPASGGSDDYAAGVHHVNLSYTLELTGGNSNGFDLPLDEIINVCMENFIGMRTFANYLVKKYSK